MARGLSRERVDEIFAAALEVITEQGFELATIDAVAARCGASKATLYRHWPSKAALLVGAVKRHTAARFTVPEQGCFRDDVLYALRLSTRWAHANSSLFLALLHAGQRDPELAAQTQRHIAAPHDAMWDTLARRWRGTDGIRFDADLTWLGPLSEGVLFQQLLPGAVEPGDEQLRRFVDEIVLPLFTT